MPIIELVTVIRAPKERIFDLDRKDGRFDHEWMQKSAASTATGFSGGGR